MIENVAVVKQFINSLMLASGNDNFKDPQLHLLLKVYLNTSTQPLLSDFVDFSVLLQINVDELLNYITAFIPARASGQGKAS